MDRSWKTKLLRRLAPILASAALASGSGRSELSLTLPTAAAEEQELFRPRLRRLPTVAESTADRALEVPAVDLSDALASIARTGPSQASGARWSDRLGPAANAGGRVNLERPSAKNTPSLFASHTAEVPQPAPPASLRRLPAVESTRPVRDVATVPSPRQPSVSLGVPQVTVPAPSTTESPSPSAGNETPPTIGPPTVDQAPAAPARRLEDVAMRAVQSRTEAMLHHAFGLAHRGAHYSAKAELVEVLRTNTQALDMRDGTTAHSDALARAFRALDEASDFEPRGSGLESNLDMAMLIAGHQTTVLKNADMDLAKVTPLAGLQSYYTYAQKQFIVAGGQQATASAALFGLGRLQTLMSGPSVGGLTAGAPQAMVFHQAAVMIDGANYKAANELGVLLARYGQYDAAREMLVHSVRVRPQVESWRNLATVHQRLGEVEMARRALHEAQLVASGQYNAADADAPVQWVPPAALARSMPQTDDLIAPVSSRTTAPAEPQTREVHGIMKFLPWTRGE